MINTLCIYSSSSNLLPPHFVEAATGLGRLMAQRGITLVYGGGCIGLMGATARAVHEHGGHVIGVIPEYLRLKEVCYEASDELIVTETMRERKAIMEDRAQAFVALPGGFGTLEEILEILTLKQLHRHAKPIVFLNTAGFYDELLALFEKLFTLGFTNPSYRAFYHVAREPQEVLDYLDAYHPPDSSPQWNL